MRTTLYMAFPPRCNWFRSQKTLYCDAARKRSRCLYFGQTGLNSKNTETLCQTISVLLPGNEKCGGGTFDTQGVAAAQPYDGRRSLFSRLSLRSCPDWKCLKYSMAATASHQ